MPSMRESRIQPLPDDVAAQIKSSIAIVSLNGVVLELVKNSLDAKATKVVVTVDFVRGGCIVEDDGLGISPAEFREDGGLGKLYYTSKYHTSETLLGGRGTFLASLAAMSLLTIVSRHHDYRSLNSIVFHHSSTVERQLPASTSHDVHGKHGTRVSVRNLFGNLPVRVKQRSKISEQKLEQDRLWDCLKRDIVALLLSWQGVVSVKSRGADSKVVLNFNTSSSDLSARKPGLSTEKPRSSKLSSLLNILTQANYIDVDQWSAWVPLSASASGVSIKGAISLDPAPSKTVQFMSLGNLPIAAASAHNELYDEINRLIALSSFGTVVDEAPPENPERTRTQKLKLRKGIDRYAMFHLRISLKDGKDQTMARDQLLEDETNLQTVVRLLNAMVTQWLAVHHFQPHKARKRREESHHSSTDSGSDAWLRDNTSTHERRPILRPRVAGASPNTSASMKRPASQAMEQTQSSRDGAFARWSRIKSAKPELFDSSVLSKSLLLRSRSYLPHETNTDPPFSHHEQNANGLDVEAVGQGAFEESISKVILDLTDVQNLGGSKTNDTVSWTDPITKTTHLLNARTGCVMPDLQAPPTSASTNSTSTSYSMGNPRSLRLRPKDAFNNRARSQWLDNMLQSWDNPIFNTTEQRIPQVSLEEPEANAAGQHGHQHCSHSSNDPNAMDLLKDTKLSKDGLRGASVIAQVDKKFILVCIPKGDGLSSDSTENSNLLVLVDQHAADERIRVEALLQDLCTHLPQSSLQTTYRSQLGHQAQVSSVFLASPIQFSISIQEQAHFVSYASRFARWGILYDITPGASQVPATQSQDQTRIAVTSLPPAISERCKADPPILISFLRSTLWSYVEDRATASLTRLDTSSEDEGGKNWVQALASCPKGLLDLVNSRACRSAIMFNDELSRGECEQLVERLNGCVFPFMCAHGRPSMVPLIDIGRDASSLGVLEDSNRNTKEGSSLVGAWKAWKKEG